MLCRYYEFDNSVIRELLGKKLTSRHRKDLDEVSEKTGVSLKSCRYCLYLYVAPYSIKMHYWKGFSSCCWQFSINESNTLLLMMLFRYNMLKSYCNEVLTLSLLYYKMNYKSKFYISFSKEMQKLLETKYNSICRAYYIYQNSIDHLNNSIINYHYMLGFFSILLSYQQ